MDKLEPEGPIIDEQNNRIENVNMPTMNQLPTGSNGTHHNNINNNNGIGKDEELKIPGTPSAVITLHFELNCFMYID